ncbi:RNA degradosome polyphosphate kinase [Helicobacter marmotae]|uniref:Polyphosphate kinase n=1 Tax=Helicobacter marmotae TaxID=152490 RepID=A0A3D8I1L8_9HELI|nr:RNA degradosome polyphosphate kinase [Helicobacter marmotae]RDU59029.1 RNA degradosome polyphosphate kinase [Helicobacter marmotae]
MTINDSKMYFNRELSWLKFNTRVLNEARNTNIPLLERLKFVAIYGTNLDEFYMIRVAGLKRLYASGITEVGADKLTPLQQLKNIREYLDKEKKVLEAVFKEIQSGLASEGMYIKQVSELDNEQKKQLHEYFINYLYPVIVPVVVDSTHPFPHLNNLSFAIALRLKSLQDGSIKFAMVRISRLLSRFVEIQSGIFIAIEDIVGEFASELFGDYEIINYIPFRITRNADMEIEEEEADDFIELMSEGLKTRRKGEVVRLEVGVDKDTSLLDFINAHLKVDNKDIYIYHIPLNLNGLWELVGSKAYAHLSSAPFNPKTLPPLHGNSEILSTMEANDIVLFHPYESFDPVVNFIQSAAKDPDVLSIRMTLYRVGKNSPIVKALIQAAENNKQVTALVELKARFDEENNLHWAHSLESAGAHVIYGVPGLKVHAKIALVIKKVGNTLKKYVHLSTGNYNPSTAKIYTDISLLTCNTTFAKDAIKLFHSLSTGSCYRTKLDSLLIAPTQIKPKILELIENETKMGANGRIIMKANAFIDVDVIRALYRASMAGVKIDLIVRGICALRPGVKGISENIRVFSIVGKYLEHARIYYFKHDSVGVYFASADIMPRNLERRVEILTPSLNADMSKRLMEILQMQLSDNVQIYELQSNGEYQKPAPAQKPFSSQLAYEEYVNAIYGDSVCNDEMDKAKKLAKRMLKES